MRTTSVLLLAFLVLARAAAAQPVVVHDLTAAFAPAEHQVQASDVVTVPREALVDGAVAFVLHPGLRITAVTANGAEATATPAPDGPPGEPRRYVIAGPFDAAVTLRIAYGGEIYDPPTADEKTRFIVGDKTSGTIGPEGVYLHGGTAWYPGVAGKGVTPLLRFDATLTTPKGWQAVGQGTRTRADEGDAGHTSRWENPITCDSLSVCAGPYVVESRDWHGVTLTTFLFEEDRGLAKAYLDAAERFLGFFSELLTPYPYRQFSIVENFFPTGYGMPSYTLLGRDVVKMAERYTGAVGLGHEILHCWWGNYVLAGETSENWCEGLTTYCANYLHLERTEGADKAREYRRHTSQRFTVLVPPGGDYAVRAFVGKVTEIDNEVGYGKCSMIFHQVRQQLGDEKFFGALRAVIRDHGGRHAAWADFQRAFETAGGAPLGEFFAQWLDRIGAPVLGNLTADVTPGAETQQVVVGIEQFPEATAAALRPWGEAWPHAPADFVPWRVRVPVVITCDGTPTAATLDLTAAHGSVTVQVPGKHVERVAIDPEHHLFRRLGRAELTPSLNRVQQAAKRAVVVPNGGDPALQKLYQGVAERCRAEGWTVVTAAEAKDDLLATHALLLLGGPDQNAVTARVLEARARAVSPAPAGVPYAEPAPWELTATAASLAATRVEGAEAAALLHFHSPWAPGESVAVFAGFGAAGATRPARLLFYYGWDNAVIWRQGQVVARGTVVAPPQTLSVEFGPR